MNTDREWLTRKAGQEDGCDVSVGGSLYVCKDGEEARAEVCAHLISQEVCWHTGHTGTSGRSDEWEKGFIAGLEQARLVCEKAVKGPWVEQKEQAAE